MKSLDSAFGENQSEVRAFPNPWQPNVPLQPVERQSCDLNQGDASLNVLAFELKL
jgi:hypothetical protein